ncbi:MAG: ComEA family DNA-binding protein [Gemmatimonadota bacterium]
MTRDETRDLARAALILLAASLIRTGWSLRPSPPLLAHLPDVGAQLLAETERLTLEEEEAQRPLAEGERLDPNRASELQLRRLPGVGPAMAGRIVASREKEGGFRGANELVRVTGIGPATVSRLEPHLDFSSGLPLELGRTSGGEPGLIDLNRADETELQVLPGIGPALARRVVEHRARHGSYRAVDDLLDVPGVGPVVLERIRPLVEIRR